jgi:AAA15 family ATPase/GTPase
MRLRRICIHNFASFGDTGWIDFSPKINLIVGQNNSGKSALLRTLDKTLSDDRHRNLQHYEAIRLPLPLVEYEFDVSGSELETAILSSVDMVNWPLESRMTQMKYSVSWPR